jgi:hypothetical protein
MCGRLTLNSYLRQMAVLVSRLIHDKVTNAILVTALTFFSFLNYQHVKIILQVYELLRKVMRISNEKFITQTSSYMNTKPMTKI